MCILFLRLPPDRSPNDDGADDVRNRPGGVARTVRVWVVGIVAALGYTTHVARGHEMHTEITPESSGIRIEFFYSDGKPAVGFEVSVRYDDGIRESLGKTGGNGDVVFRPTTRRACVVFARAAGHGAERVIPLDVIGPVFDAASSSEGEQERDVAGVSAPSIPLPVPGDDPSGTADGATTGEIQFGSLKQRASSFPAVEVLASVAFISVLAVVTIVLMRISHRTSTDRPGDRSALLREIDDLRAEVRRLRKGHHES